MFYLFNSLKNAKKHGSRRPNKHNQQISIITSENSGLNPNNHSSQMQQTQQQQLYDNRMNTQVKTYTDQGNGHNAMRAGNSSHYSKVRDSNNIKIFKLRNIFPLNKFRNFLEILIRLRSILIALR